MKNRSIPLFREVYAVYDRFFFVPFFFLFLFSLFDSTRCRIFVSSKAVRMITLDFFINEYNWRRDRTVKKKKNVECNNYSANETKSPCVKSITLIERKCLIDLLLVRKRKFRNEMRLSFSI